MTAAASDKVKTMAIKLIIRQAGINKKIGLDATHVFESSLITVGTAPNSSLMIDSTLVAPEQWLIINESEQPFLVNRAKGTFWHDEELPLEARRPLADGDLVRAGDVVIEVGIIAGEIMGLADETKGPAIGAPELEGIVKNEPEAIVGESIEVRPPNRFAAILDSLRTDEDRYYFLLESGTQSGARLLVEDQELVVGWDQTGINITADPWAVALPRLRVTKNWSGVFVAAPHPDEVEVNGEPLQDPRRLRHSDRVVIAPALSPADDGVVLVFHEPTSLVVLDNLLPESLPLPLAQGEENEPSSEEKAILESANIAGPTAKSRRTKQKMKPAHLYFGAFAAGDILLMACATILGAVVVFLFLVYG